MMLKATSSPIRVIVLDIGGVCIENPADSLLNYFADYMGTEVNRFKIPYLKFFPQWERGQLTEEQFWQSIAHCLDLHFHHPSSLWFEAVERIFTIKWDTLQWATKLKSLGYQLAILSNTEVPTTGFFRQQGWEQLFDYKCYSCLEGVAKPEALIYSKLEQMTGAKSQQLLFVDDKWENLQAASQRGWQVIHYQNNLQFYRELQQRNLK